MDLHGSNPHCSRVTALAVSVSVEFYSPASPLIKMSKLHYTKTCDNYYCTLTYITDSPTLIEIIKNLRFD